MGRLRYTALTSLDGYVADAYGGFGWATPDDQVHRAINDLEREVGTIVYGRRMFEVMRYWATAPEPGETSAAALPHPARGRRRHATHHTLARAEPSGDGPVVVGGGLPWLPTGLQAQFELAGVREVSGGVVHLHYRTV